MHKTICYQVNKGTCQNGGQQHAHRCQQQARHHNGFDFGYTRIHTTGKQDYIQRQYTYILS